MGSIYVEQIAHLTEVIDRLAGELETSSKTDEQLRRLCTIPGIGPVTAGAVAAFAPDIDTFDSGRNFAAWLGVGSVTRTDRVPARTAATKVDGRKGQTGISRAKMGQTDIRRLLIVGASRQRRAFRWVVRKGGSANRWLAALVARKPKMVAAVALANSERCSATGSSASRTARMIWALSTKQKNYRMA
ncbi:transposase [Roseinatronobacter sp. NSM]|uniref:transposase n=1 Tax=Roseinatronobacter sp. NSM TaxID=3457785 RepID=UPI004036FE41